MTAVLFSTWISRFISILTDRYGISHENRHLLLLDGHGSHVTLEVVQKAKSEGLDIITLPSHTNHRLQPLDVSIFKPFKVAFRACRDRWSIENKSRGARKEELAEWVGIALKKVLTPIKIMKGFEATGIWPLQPNAMDKYMAPSTCYIESSEDEDGDDGEEEVPVCSNAGAEDLIPETQELPQQYFIQSESDSDDCSGNSNSDSEGGPSTMVQQNLFPLPRIERHARRASQTSEPLIDYSKSILMTSDEYIAAMTTKAAWKEAVAKEREERKIQAEQRKAQRLEEKAKREADKVLRRLQAEKKRADWKHEQLRKVIERARKLSETEAMRHRRNTPQPHSRHPDASPPTIRASNAYFNGSPLSLPTKSRTNVMR